MSVLSSGAAMVAIYTMLALSFLIVMRMGEISFGQQAYFGIGAYVSAILTTMFQWSFAASAVASIFATVAVASALGAVALRMSGFEFSLYSLISAEFVREVLGRLTWQVEVAGRMVGPEGTMGFAAIASFNQAGLTEVIQALLVVSIAIATVIGVQRISASRHGRMLATVASDRELAQARGISTDRLRMQAYLLASSVAGLGGCMFAHYVTFIDPANFGLMTGVHALAYTLIGGVGSALGALAGTTLDVVFLESFRVVGSYRMVAFGALIVVALALMPRGIFAKRKPTHPNL